MSMELDEIIFDYTLCCCCQSLSTEKLTVPKSLDSYVEFEKNITELCELNALPQKIKKYSTFLIEGGNNAQNLYSNKAKWHNSCWSSVNKQKVEFARTASQKRKKREERAKRESGIPSKRLRSCTTTASASQNDSIPSRSNESYDKTKCIICQIDNELLSLRECKDCDQFGLKLREYALTTQNWALNCRLPVNNDLKAAKAVYHQECLRDLYNE